MEVPKGPIALLSSLSFESEQLGSFVSTLPSPSLSVLSPHWGEGGRGAPAFTKTESETEPPGPLQAIVKVELEVTLMLSFPLDALAPDHAPDAVHGFPELVLVAFHVTATVKPALTVMGPSELLALISTVGGSGVAKFTWNESELSPPAPLQVRVKVELWVIVKLSVPLGAFAPDQLPEATQEVAFETFHDKVIEEP